MRKIDRFRMRMEKPKEIYTEELEKFSKKYDFLGDMRIIEEPDIDTLDYIYCFNKLNETSEETLDLALKEIYDHMDDYSDANGISKYCENVIISFNKWLDDD